MKTLFRLPKKHQLSCLLEADSPEMSALPSVPVELELGEPLYIERVPFEIGRIRPHGVLQIPDRSPFQISKRHCTLLLRENGLWISDFSRLGTIVNGLTIGGSDGTHASITVRAGEHSLILGLPTSVFRFKLAIESAVNQRSVRVPTHQAPWSDPQLVDEAPTLLDWRHCLRTKEADF